MRIDLCHVRNGDISRTDSISTGSQYTEARGKGCGTKPRLTTAVRHPPEPAGSEIPSPMRHCDGGLFHHTTAPASGAVFLGAFVRSMISNSPLCRAGFLPAFKHCDDSLFCFPVAVVLETTYGTSSGPRRSRVGTRPHGQRFIPNDRLVDWYGFIPDVEVPERSATSEALYQSEGKQRKYRP